MLRPRCSRRFSQGAGEITVRRAVEMGGFPDRHVDLIKRGMQSYGGSDDAIFMPGRTDPQYGAWLASRDLVTLDGELRSRTRSCPTNALAGTRSTI